MAGFADLLATHAGHGRVEWIGLRPERLAPVTSVEQSMLEFQGFVGDHGRPGKRAVTLIQAEHLPVIAALAQGDQVQPEMLRRNIVISGINLTALRHARLMIGDAEVAISVPCAPCSRMEKALGTGGYNAMRGHGGWCAEVKVPGRVAVGDTVHVVPVAQDAGFANQPVP
ncbi:MAG: MOSC domain-containing protein [Albidovulum sp.]